jgi:hypothetical protein
MLSGEQSGKQHIIGLPFTVYCLPHALRSALSALRLTSFLILLSGETFCSGCPVPDSVEA